MGIVFLLSGEQSFRKTQLEQKEWQIEELMHAGYSLSNEHC